MSLIDKKYFSIKEVSDLTGIPAYKLRYLEKSISKIDVFKIRGRRYYTINDINLIKEKIGISDAKEKIVLSVPTNSFFSEQIINNSNDEIISRIDSLIANFIKLEKELELELELE